MKYLKLFENYDTYIDVEETIIKYVVKFDLVDYSDDPIEEESFDDLKDAKDYYDDTYIYTDEKKYKDKQHYKSLAKIEYKVTYKYDPEIETKDDITDDNKEWVVEDYDIIESENYSINEKSENLLSSVEDWFKDEYSSNDWKYHIINVDYIDEDGDEETKTIQVRISDHTENINNIDRHGRPDYHISIVISNYDVTKDRFWSNDFERRNKEYELKYNSDDNIEDIKNDIIELIDQIKEEIEES